MAEYKSFYEYFVKYPQDDDLRDILQCAKLKNVYVQVSERKMKTFILFDNYLSPMEVSHIEKTMREAYSLNQVKIIDCYDGIKSAEYMLNTIEQLKAEIPVLTGYCDGEFEFDGQVFKLAVKFGGEETLSQIGCEKKASEFLEKKFGIALKVVFFHKEVEISTIEVFEEKAVLAAAKENPVKTEQRKSNKKTNRPGRVLLGNAITGDIIEIGDIKVSSEIINTSGTVSGCRTVKVGESSEMMIFTLEEDNHAIDVKFYLNDTNYTVVENIHDGDYVTVRGKAADDKRSAGLTIKPYAIVSAEKEVRTDTYSQKRSELHIHSSMSTADGLCYPEEIVKKAIDWGLKAIAITDHGCINAFPRALKAAQGSDLKVICGMEGYFVNDSEPAVYGKNDIETALNDRFIVFDIETTGLSASSDRITEIGAVVLENGEQKEVFGTFVNPHMAIPRHIVELTGITDAMVKDAPDEKEALEKFFEFAKGSVLVAHNANFDCGFIRAASRRCGMDFNYSYIDTVPICRSVFPELKSVKLNVVAEHIGASEFNHHRAYDDAKELAEIFVYLVKRLARSGKINNIGDINGALKGDSINVNRSSHVTLLAKNKVGLRNLYKIISESYDKYFQKFPIITKSLLSENREGILVGSSCCDGEIFKMFLDGRSEDDITAACRFYDYLEIQPLENNMNMVDSGYMTESDQLRHINSKIIEFGNVQSIPVVATGDAHFIEAEDEPLREIAMSVRGSRFDHSKGPLYFKTTEEMLEDFYWLGAELQQKVVIDTPNAIADMCDDLSAYADSIAVPQTPYASVESLITMSEDERRNRRISNEIAFLKNSGLERLVLFAYMVKQFSAEDKYPCYFAGELSTYVVAFELGLIDVDPYLYDVEYNKEINKSVIAYYTPLEYKYKLAERFNKEYGPNHYFYGSEIEFIPKDSARGYATRFEENTHTVVREFIYRRFASALAKNRRNSNITMSNMYIIPKNMDYFDFSPVYSAIASGVNLGPMSHYDNGVLRESLVSLQDGTDADKLKLCYAEKSSGIKVTDIPSDDINVFSLFGKREKGVIKDGLEGLSAVKEIREKVINEVHSVFDLIRSGIEYDRAITIYRLLWFKYYHSADFYAAVLSSCNSSIDVFDAESSTWFSGFENDGDDALVRRTLMDMSGQGIGLGAFNLYDCAACRFVVNNGKILMPLSLIEDVTVAEALSIERERSLSEFVSVDDLSERCGLSKNSVSALRKRGLFNRMDENAQLSMFNMLDI